MRLLLLALSVALCFAETIPKIDAKAVSGKAVSLPAAVAGAPAVLVFGFSKDSDKQIRQWAKRLNAEKVTVYSLPVLESVPRLVRGMAVSGIKGSTDASYRDFMVPVFANEAALKALVQYSAADDAYVVLLDPAGNIQWKGHGVAPDTFQKCLAALAPK
jgi:hypothetical protein